MTRSCPECGRPFDDRGELRVCSVWCQRAAAREAGEPVSCYDCGEPLGTGDPARLYRCMDEDACHERVEAEQGKRSGR